MDDSVHGCLYTISKDKHESSYLDSPTITSTKSAAMFPFLPGQIGVCLNAGMIEIRSAFPLKWVYFNLKNHQMSLEFSFETRKLLVRFGVWSYLYLGKAESDDIR